MCENIMNLANGTDVICSSSGGKGCKIILNLDQWFRKRCCLKKSLKRLDDAQRMPDNG